MKLSDYDLRQIDEERINKLSESAVKNLSITLLNDLKEARERLNQNSNNSSMPPSSEAPWDKASHYEDEEKDDESSGDIEALDKAIHADTGSLPKDRRPDEINSLSLSEASSEPATTLAIPQDSPRKPGKQPGAQGFGREQKITVHQHEHHYPDQCALCNLVSNPEYNSVAYTAFDTLTLKWGDLNQPGITVVNTRHTYYNSACQCGHVTQAAPLGERADSFLPYVEV